MMRPLSTMCRTRAARVILIVQERAVIQVEGLRKAYGDLTAVDGVSFEARPGAIFGLLGPNGAGKSTTIGCMSGLIAPTAGRITIDGHDVVRDGRAARAGLGVVPQELAIYDDISAAENLSYWGEAYGLTGAGLRQRVREVLELTALADRAKEPVKRFSGGMKRRLNFGCGIVHRPRVLLLDEPTVGVDPQSRVRLLDLVREQAAAGACVLYTTHYMEEAQALCERIGIIDHGRLIALGSLEDLRTLHGADDIVRFAGTFDPAAVQAAIAAIEGARVVEAAPSSLILSMREASRRLPQLFEVIDGAGGEIRETTMIQPNLESLFIKLTGRELRE
jgi:ABC-2 type transport system ATP-binding protein